MRQPMFVGIDVSKARLDVALQPGDENFRVANNARRIANLVKRLKKLQVSHMDSRPAVVMRSQLLVSWPQLHCRLQYLIHGRFGILPELRAGWQRPIRSMPKCWHSSLI